MRWAVLMLALAFAVPVLAGEAGKLICAEIVGK